MNIKNKYREYYKTVSFKNVRGKTNSDSYSFPLNGWTIDTFGTWFKG